MDRADGRHLPSFVPWKKEISCDAEELFQPRELREILIGVITGVPRGSRYLGIPERQGSKTETARIRVSV